MPARVYEDSHVTGGPACPGTIDREGGGAVGCDRKAIAVVEDRRMYKCGYGHRWPRDRDSESDKSVA